MSWIIGAYGKIPVLGDFFRIGLPQAFTDPWDRWLQMTLTQGREVLGPRWEPCYFSAPIWRVSVSAGVMGPTAMHGVLMPSVDRVGRAFPLTLAVMCPPFVSALSAHLAMRAHFEQLETLALSALEDDMTRETLSLGLSAIPAPPASGALGVGSHRDASLVALNLPHGDALAGLVAVPELYRPVVMSCLIGDRELVLASGSMPTGRTVAALFDMSAPLWTIQPHQGIVP